MRRVLRAVWRPLPLAILAMTLLVLVKLDGLASGLGPSVASIGASARRSVLPSAIAAESKPPAAAPAKPPTPPEQPPAPAPAASVPDAGPSEAERALLLDLRARREALESREKALDSQAGLLKAAERGLSDRLDQLAALQARLEALEKSRRERDEANWRGLVKTYEAMRPRDAASIFNELEQTVLMQMLDRMKEAKAAAVLAAMLPDRARAATAQLAQWRIRAAEGPARMIALRTMIPAGIRAGMLCLAAGSAVAAGPTPAVTAPATQVRVGDHPGFGRVVFDLPPDATSHVVVEGERVLMVFHGAGAVLQPSELPRNVRAIHTGADTATLELAPGAKARPVRIGERLVVDVLDAGSSSPANRASAVQGKTLPGKPVPAKASPARSPDPPPIPAPATPAVADSRATPIAAPQEPSPAPAMPAASAPPVPVAQETRPAPVAVAAPPETMSFVIKADSDVGAAAFRRGEYGLIVLDRRLAEQAVPQGVTWTKGPTSAVLQIALPPDMALRLSRSGAGWTVDRVPAWLPDMLVQRLDEAGVALAMARPGRMVAVLDPVSRGTLLVGAALAAEGGVPGGRRNPAYRLLPSWLGIAVEPSSDQVDLRPGPAGFVLTGGGPAPVLAGGTISRRFDLPDEPVPALANRLRAQLASAATAAPRARSAARLAAAQSMIALGMGAEAQALVQQVAADDPQQEADAQTSSLAAVAALLTGRFEEAAALDDPRLDGTVEIGLWRGLRDRKLGNDTEAARKLGGTAPLALAYPASLRRLIWPDVAEAAVEAGIAVPAEQLPPYAKALLLERNGDVDGALAAYDSLAAGPDRLGQVRATARGAELRLASARMSPADAAVVMERQSYAWRGDGLEYAFRLRAAELRAAAQEWRPALEALRAIETAYPDRKPAVHRRKVDVMQAMLTAMGAGLSAVDLVLLAADYQDCLPEGQAGSAMARLLAEKLAALDLPARTIPVLQGLVRATQAGEARAEFGVHLGELLLDGGDPAGAIAALEASAATDLPPLLHERRQLLLARSRAQTGNVPAAVAGLLDLGTERADDLRATLLAKAGDWRGSLSALGDLVGKRVPREGRLSDGAQDLLVRQAEAAARAGASTVLQQLRPSAARLEGARGDVFRLLTAAPLGDSADLPRAGNRARGGAGHAAAVAGSGPPMTAGPPVRRIATA